MELKKKFKPRIKARIRKNKQILSKNIDNFFEWIKGAELVELNECNTDEDPVRPELDNIFIDNLFVLSDPSFYSWFKFF